MKKLLLTSIILLQANTVFASNNHDHSEHTQMSGAKAQEHAQKHLRGVPDQIKNYFKNGKVDLVHKFLTVNQMNNVKKYSGVKTDNYFHTFVAVGNNNGKKSQLGAGSLVKVEDTKEIEFGIIYDNNLVIKDILPIKNANDLKPFLNQFKGKDHHSSFSIGKDLKYTGNNSKIASKIAQAVKVDVLTIQELWGKAHKH